MIYRFGSCRLDTARLELRCGTDPVQVEPQVFRLLQYLIENRDKVVSKDELIDQVWEGRIVSDATLSSRINAARRAVDDDGKEQAVIRTMPRRGFRFVADVSEIAAGTPDPGAEPSTPRAATAESEVRAVREGMDEQEIRFCTSSDGVGIAYATMGEGLPLVKAANWLNHLEFDWQSPIWRHMFAELSRDRQLVRYDERGNGLSDWEAEDISFEAFVVDLETVVDAAGLERFDLLGISQGCAVSIAYAVRHPERVSRLVLYGGYPVGWARRGEKDREKGSAMVELIRQGWGQDNPAFRQMFTSQMMPGATAEQMQWLNELQRTTTSPEIAARIRIACGDIDVTSLMPQVSTPTLVLHAREDALAPFEGGRKMAAMIPGARFVPLESRNHLLIESEPAWQRFLSEVRSFLA